MMNKPITCQIERLDYDELLGFMRQQAEDSFPSLKEEEHLLAFSKKLHTHAEFCLCRNEGKLVGMIAFYANGQGVDFVYIPHVYVSPDYRQKGLFTCMLDIIVNYVKKKGFHEIRLEVDKQNKFAQHSYQNNGFEFISSRNIEVHSLYMRKIL